jgi:hypothetical protein
LAQREKRQAAAEPATRIVAAGTRHRLDAFSIPCGLIRAALTNQTRKYAKFYKLPTGSWVPAVPQLAKTWHVILFLRSALASHPRTLSPTTDVAESPMRAYSYMTD